MTQEEFNEKYKDFIEEGFSGLEFDNPVATEYLDKEFQELIKIPGFKFSQIKFKWFDYRFYADAVHTEDIYRIEDELFKITS